MHYTRNQDPVYSYLVVSIPSRGWHKPNFGDNKPAYNALLLSFYIFVKLIKSFISMPRENMSLPLHMGVYGSCMIQICKFYSSNMPYLNHGHLSKIAVRDVVLAKIISTLQLSILFGGHLAETLLSVEVDETHPAGNRITYHRFKISICIMQSNL